MDGPRAAWILLDPGELPVAAGEVVAQREHATVSDLDAEVPQERVARALEHPKDMQTPRAEVERARLAVSAIDLGSLGLLSSRPQSGLLITSRANVLSFVR
jgi:hypothetical protein